MDWIIINHPKSVKDHEKKERGKYFSMIMRFAISNFDHDQKLNSKQAKLKAQGVV